MKEFGAVQEVSDSEYFVQISDSGSPVRVRLPAQTADPAWKAEATRLLLEAGRTMDLTEPLARVEAAIKMLWSDEGQTPTP